MVCETQRASPVAKKIKYFRYILIYRKLKCASKFLTDLGGVSGAQVLLKRNASIKSGLYSQEHNSVIESLKGFR